MPLSLAVGGLVVIVDIGVSRLYEERRDRVIFVGEQNPAVVWFTGLPRSGKTTVAAWVADQLRAQGFRVEHLDGDVIRHVFPDTGFSRAERDAHVRRVGYLASRLETNGVFVVASFVSPYEDSRQFVRGLCSTFLEIYVATPLEVCEQRDAHCLYARARRGEISNVTGINDPYEPPSRPELVIDTSVLTVEEAGNRVINLLRRSNVNQLTRGRHA